MFETIFLWTTILSVAGLYLVSFILSLKGKKYMPFWIVGASVDFIIIVYNFAVNSYVPFVSMFQILIFISACFFPLAAFLRCVAKKKGYDSFFILASFIFILGPVFMDKSSVWDFPPALRSPWFIPHILVYMISYSLSAVAFLITIGEIVRKKNDSGTVYSIIRMAFPFLTCGMLFGAVWANEIWGDFWSFDVKECWALISWLINMLYLHFYRKEKLRKYCRVLAILGFIAVISTFLFARVSGGDSMHSYS